MLPDLLLAQAVIERGMLDAAATGIVSVAHRTELWLATGNNKYLVIGAVVLLVLMLIGRRR